MLKYPEIEFSGQMPRGVIFDLFQLAFRFEKRANFLKSGKFCKVAVFRLYRGLKMQV